jgi:hypothetical protein
MECAQSVPYEASVTGHAGQVGNTAIRCYSPLWDMRDNGINNPV